MEKKSKASKVSSYIILGLKSTKLLKIIQAIKLFKFAKPFVMIFSMLISILAYSAVWSPAFAIGLVFLLLVHEMGHVVAMNKEGFKTNAPVFIPFVGAMLFSPKNMDRRQEAVIGIGGVVFGGILSFILLGINFFYPSKYLLLFAYMGFALNLFQMIPLSPMDGGRVIQAVGRNFQFIGIIILIALTIMIHQTTILIIWIIVMFDFKFLSLPQRILVASAVELALIIFTVLKIGIQDNVVFVASIIDAIIGLLYVAIIIAGYMYDRDGTEAAFISPERPMLNSRQKYFWLAAFVLSVSSLVSAMIYLSPVIKELKF